MKRSLPDIEHFDSKVSSILKEAEKNRSGLFDLLSLSKKIGLDQNEIEALHYHLKRNDMIEEVRGSIFRISKYGRMIQSGQITQGYAPI